MNDELDWTEQLGEAFVADEAGPTGARRAGGG